MTSRPPPPCHVVLAFVVCCRAAFAFNLAPHPLRVFSGPEDALFGLSTHFYSHEDSRWLLVSAPRASSPFPAQHGLRRPGLVYSCPLTHPTRQECEPAEFDTKGNEVHAEVMYYHYNESKDGQFLGLSLNTYNDMAVACGHLWHNTYHHKAGNNLNQYFINGACYELDRGLDPDSAYTSRPLINYKDQLKNNEYYLAMAMVGFSTHYTQDGTLLLGAPGVKNFAGAIYHATTDGRLVVLSPTFMPQDSYWGYSVGSLQGLLGEGARVVAGAPRYNNRGKVVMYHIRQIPGSDESDEVVVFHKAGSQHGSYFGASVLGGDFNADGFDDLLVGAPLYNGSTGDEGRVFVYMYDRLQRTYVEQDSLMGSNYGGSRFGLAMAFAGDINLDSYNDVLVSAPYENDGAGAVYLYLGTATSVSSMYAQRITPRDIGVGCSTGFGYSLAANMDVDNNQYPDIAVGCYGDNVAAVLLARPVVNIAMQLTTHSTQINFDTPTCIHKGESATCVQVQLTLSYSGTGVPDTVNVIYRVHLDTARRHAAPPRGQFVHDYSNATYVVPATLVRDAPVTTNLTTIVFKEIPHDLFTPFLIEVDYEMEEIDTDPAPVLNQLLPQMAQLMLQFTKECGADDICRSDLSVSMETPERIIVGDDIQIPVRFSVTNRGEAAYRSELVLSHPWELTFVRVRSHGAHHIICQPQPYDPEVNHTTHLICELGHPLPSQAMQLFTIDFQQRAPLVQHQNLLLVAAVRTNSQDMNEENNRFEVSVPLDLDYNIVLYGASDPDQLSVGVHVAHDVLIQHSFDVFNRGPGLLPHAEVAVRVPRFGKDEDGQKVTVQSVKMYREPDEEPANCYPPDEIFVDVPDPTSNVTQEFDLMKLAKWGHEKINEPVKQTKHISCHNVPCTEFRCGVSELAAGHNILIVINYRLQSYLKNMLLDLLVLQSTLELSSPGNTMAESFLLQHNTSTPVYLVHPPAPASLPAPAWLLALSVCFGLGLLAAGALIMWRCGFFRRQKHEELVELLKEKARQERASAMYGEETYEDIRDSMLDNNNINEGRVQIDLIRGQASYRPPEDGAGQYTDACSALSAAAAASKPTQNNYEDPISPGAAASLDMGEYLHPGKSPAKKQNYQQLAAANLDVGTYLHPKQLLGYGEYLTMGNCGGKGSPEGPTSQHSTRRRVNDPLPGIPQKSPDEFDYRDEIDEQKHLLKFSQEEEPYLLPSNQPLPAHKP